MQNNSTLYLVIITAFLLVAFTEIPTYIWVVKNLKQPFSRFKKNKGIQKSSHILTKSSKRSLDYYMRFDLDSLKNMKLDISSKIIRYSESNHFSNHIAIMLSVVGLSLAGIAIASEILPQEYKGTILLMIQFLVLPVAIVFTVLFFGRTLSANVMDRHLFFIEKAIEEKTLKVNRERKPRNMK